MSKDYSFDRSAFRAYKAEESESDYSYWENRSIDERMKAGTYLIASAYGFEIGNPPKFDRGVFEAFKRA